MMQTTEKNKTKNKKSAKQTLAALLGRDLPLRIRTFRMISVVGGSVAALALIETFFLTGFTLMLFPLVLLFITLVVALFLSMRFKFHKAASILVELMLTLVVFPDMYFINGGVNGGASVWFLVSFIYIFLLFSGKSLIIFSVINLLAEVMVYAIGYYYPGLIKPLESQLSVVIDSFFSVIAVGFAAGAMLKFQTNLFEQERKVVEEQKRELEEAGKSKDLFFASMSHEIRTPINTVIGLNEMILRDNFANPKTYENAKNVQNAGKLLLNLINDILDFSQLEMDRLQIANDPYVAHNLFSEMIMMTKTQINGKRLDFYYEIDERIPATLEGDKKHIEQILLNLLSNAIKYTKQGYVRFTVTMEEKREQDVLLVFQVEDTGIGIRKEDMSGLYDAFKRLDSVKNKEIQGSGLGLAITKQLVDLMEGTIDVDSIYTKGSTFTVKLRQKYSGTQEIGDIERYVSDDGHDRRKYEPLFTAPEGRILIVDDSVMNLNVVTSLLSATKLQIDTAMSGEECLRLTLRHYYHAILLDHMMPGMNGTETLNEIRNQQNGLCKESPIIALTANARANADAYYVELGFQGYLSKPVDSELLEQKIAGMLPAEIVQTKKENRVMYEAKGKQSMRRNFKKNIMITTDCVAEMPQRVAEKFGIGIMYLYITTDKGRFEDTKEISPNNLRNYMLGQSGRVQADSASVEEFEEFFGNCLEHADNIIHISMSSIMGKTYGNAVEAAKSFSHVQVVDSKQVSCGQSLVVFYAAKLAREGKSIPEIIRGIEEISEHVESHFLLTSVETFSNKGYAGNLIRRLCHMNVMLPSFSMKNGKLTYSGLYSGDAPVARKRMLARKLHMKEAYRGILLVSEAGLLVEEQNDLLQYIKSKYKFQHCIMQRASFSCACNAGVGTYGFAYMKDVPEEMKAVLDSIQVIIDLQSI